MMSLFNELPVDITVTSDASGNWGCGAFSGDKWFQVQWNSKNQSNLDSHKGATSNHTRMHRVGEKVERAAC